MTASTGAEVVREGQGGGRPAVPVPSVRVVIVNWNAGPYLRACLDALARAEQRGYLLRRVVVVDNASTDGSVAACQEATLPVEVIRNVTNRGFGAACNQGAEGAAEDLLLFLNPDAQPAPDALARAVDAMAAGTVSRVGIVGVRMVDERGATVDSCSRFPDLRGMVGRATGLQRLLPALFPPQSLPADELQSDRPVDQVIGAFFLIRRSLFEQLHGFDERYFLYYEEVDLSLRARAAGHRSHYVADACCLHRGSVSSDQVPVHRLRYTLDSRVTFARTHWPPWKAELTRALTPVELGIRLIGAVARRRGSEALGLLWVARQLLAASPEGQAARPLPARSAPRPTPSDRRTSMLLELLRCPECHASSLALDEAAAACGRCQARYPVLGGKPVLIPRDNALHTVVLEGMAEPRDDRFRAIAKRALPNPGVNLSRKPCLVRMLRTIARRPEPRLLVVGSGQQQRELAPLLAAHPEVTAVYCDVDTTALIDLFSDAHELPFVDGAFDAVVITGVLNSTLYPEQAVAEVRRVLREGGLVYSELAFVQHVAFGAYDFRRYTLTGHRHLFRRFREVHAGITAGPATVLYWTLENIALCLSVGERSQQAIKGLLRLTLSWIKHLDHLLVAAPSAVDGAATTYLVGRVDEAYEAPDEEIIAAYRGAQRELL